MSFAILFLEQTFATTSPPPVNKSIKVFIFLGKIYNNYGKALYLFPI